MNRIINTYTSFKKYGGAELITLSLAAHFSETNSESILLSTTKCTDFHECYDTSNIHILTFNMKLLLSIKKEDTVISHHRMLTSIFMVLRVILFKNFRLIHVAHNEFSNLKYLTFLPREIIAVSEGVKSNLIKYFNVSPSRIIVIYNGIHDKGSSADYMKSQNKFIKIIYPARITYIKQQLEIVKALKGKISSNIKIYFAGVGPQIDILKDIVYNDDQFSVLGFVDTNSIFSDFDYVLLCSTKEGLPTTLIEACMHSKPIICNNVGGNLEILTPGKNGYLVNNLKDLSSVLNNVVETSSLEYIHMCQASRTIYENKFTLSIMIEKYKKLVLQ